MSYCPVYSVDIGSVSVFTVQIDDTSDENEVSDTAGVYIHLVCFSCLMSVCCYSSKLVIVY